MDVTGVRTTSFFEVTTQTNKYQVADVTSIYLPYLDVTTQPGDVNSDGFVDINDVTDLIGYVLGIAGDPIDTVAADVFEDGFVDINDVTALINIVLGMA